MKLKMNSFQLVKLCFFVVIVRQCNSCQPPTENNPVSVCAFCSDNHAAMRWMVHSAHGSYDEGGVHSINFEFECNMLEDNETKSYDNDDCFDGLQVSSTLFGEWRWYILERELPIGSTCTFKAKMRDVWENDLPTLQSSCTTEVKDYTACPVFPVSSCSGSPGDSQCSCNCNQGYTTHNASTGRGVSCKNIDECSLEEHHCSGADECVDTEGSYWCDGDAIGSGAQQMLVPNSLDALFRQPCIPVNEKLTTATSTTTINTDASTGTQDAFTTTSYIHVVQKTVSTGQPDSVIQVVLILGSLLAVMLVLVLLTVVVAIKRCKSRRMKQLNHDEQFDPDYNPVIIDKLSSSAISLASNLNSLYHLDLHKSGSKKILNVVDPDVESCVSDVTCVGTLCDHAAINSEQSSNISQILDVSEPSQMSDKNESPSEQSSLTLDMVSLREHDSSGLNLSAAVSQIPQSVTSTDGYTRSCFVGNLVESSSKYVPTKRLNSVTSGYVSLTESTELASLSPTFHQTFGEDSAPVKFQWNSNLNSEGRSYIVNLPSVGLDESLISTPVYFEFPHNST